MHHGEQLIVQSIETGLALERVRQVPRQHSGGELQDAVALVGEQRIPKHDVNGAPGVGEQRQLVEDIADATGSVRRLDPMRTVRAELGATPAGQEWQRAPARPAGKGDADGPASRGQHIPMGKRECVEICDLRAFDHPRQSLAVNQPLQRRFRLTADDEVR